MELYSIADLEQLSGIKAHTIRIWEQRYGALHPLRTEGNNRRYDDTQLKRLMNIITLQQSGEKISKLSKLSDTELSQQLEKEYKSESGNPLFDYFINGLIVAGLGFDEAEFCRLLDDCILELGWRQTYSRVLLTILNRMGLLWGMDTLNAAQEHFVSHLIRQKISAATDLLPLPEKSNERWILFLPHFENHELGLLFANYLLKISGRQVVYLGGSLPIDALDSAIQSFGSADLLFFMVHDVVPETVENYCNDVLKIKGIGKCFLSAKERLLTGISIPNGITTITSVVDFEKLLS